MLHLLEESGHRNITTWWTKLALCLTQHYVGKQLEEHDMLLAHSGNADLESCPEVLLHQKIQAARQRDDKHAYTACKAGNLQQSKHRAWPLIRKVGFYGRHNCSTTWNRPKYILVTLFAFLSIYITF